ncbi:MAG: type II secretion system protein GspD [Kiritimatiellia bacterium]
MSANAVRLLPALGLLMVIAACSTTAPTPKETAPAISRQLSRAQALYQQGNLRDAMIECAELARKDPEMPGLIELQNKILARLTEERLKAAELATLNTNRRMDLDVQRVRVLPDTYGMQRRITGLSGSVGKGIPSNMEKVLQKKVTVNLDGVSLNDFILALGAAEDVNIIADAAVDTGATMTVRADDVPLAELLDYISRNMGVSFFVGENVIWVTPRDTNLPTTPMETRIYRLRKGLSGSETGAGTQIRIMEAVQRFVPALPGADLLFDPKAHAIIARNTRENLAKIEEIIEALDVCPPQIVIEARFVLTSVTDLRELGVDWILNSPLVVSKNAVLRSSSVAKIPHTQIEPGQVLDFTSFENEKIGLNLKYTGLLTDPMFQAVLHALETSKKARTLSVPKVTTVNNHPATIRVGKDFRYFEEYRVESVPTSVSGAGSQVYSTVLVPVGTPALEELGIQLTVTPSVGADMRSITLSLVPEISDLDRFEYYETSTSQFSGQNVQQQTTTTNVLGRGLIKLPIFSRSRIETEVVVQSGETVVMGGLITSKESKAEEGVPILSSIPLIGRLFRHDVINEIRDNLLIFVTATILSQRGENLIPIEEVAAPTGAQAGD